MNSPEASQDRDLQREAFSQTALDCYLAAIAQIADTLEAACPEIGSSFREQLIRIRRRLAFEASVKILEESRDALDKNLAAFAERARRYQAARADDVKQTFTVLAHAGDALSVRSHGYAGQFREFADKLDEIGRSGDPAPPHEALREQAAGLRDLAETMGKESQAAFGSMQQQLGEFQNKLLEAEFLASVDPLTGLANRLEFNRQIAARIDSDKPFCLLLFDLDNFKVVNDRFGHLCGDEILKQAGARLNGQIRTRDFVCRWGGDEFLVIMECGLANAAVRARQIAQWLGGPYRFAIEGHDLTV